MKCITKGKENLFLLLCKSQTSPASLVLLLRSDSSHVKPIRLGGMPQKGCYLQVGVPQCSFHHGKLNVSKLLWITLASWPLHQHQGEAEMRG